MKGFKINEEEIEMIDIKKGNRKSLKLNSLKLIIKYLLLF